MADPLPILFLSKTDAWCGHARDLATALFGARLEAHSGSVGDPLPAVTPRRRLAAILSFLSPWILPKSLIDQAELALNFHPGSRDYPGIGCYNFALYEGVAEYGVVCHHMDARVDTGAIVTEERFAVMPGESVETLKLRSMVVMLELFHRVATAIARGEPLPRAARTWSRKPFTRAELNALGEITPEMPEAEIRRRVHAMTYPGYPGAQLRLGAQLFSAPAPGRKPLA
jgi:methionyl-tRNA formyltransferase